MIALVHLT